MEVLGPAPAWNAAKLIRSLTGAWTLIALPCWWPVVKLVRIKGTRVPHQRPLAGRVKSAAKVSGEDMPVLTPVKERFWAKVNKDGPLWKGTACWLWLAGCSNGYGQITVDGNNRQAHRVAYEMLVGPIPEGLQLDHLCRVQLCVNPAHTEPVAQRINILRGIGITAQAARKTECPQGHPYSEVNTYTSPQGGRACRICKSVYRQRSAIRSL